MYTLVVQLINNNRMSSVKQGLAWLMCRKAITIAIPIASECVNEEKVFVAVKGFMLDMSEI